jgi:hypothetical protein
VSLPRWPRAEVQASVEGSGAGSPARKATAVWSRGRRGFQASQLLASRCPKAPRADSGS